MRQRARLLLSSAGLASTYVVDSSQVRAADATTGGHSERLVTRLPASALVPSAQRFYNTVAVVAVLVVLGSFAAAFYGGAAAPGAPSSPSAGGKSYVYITVVVNPNNGMPQFSPGNFTVLRGEVQFTIIDQDAPVLWTNCTCNVTGTVGGVEDVNGTPLSVIASSNVAHTFTIGKLGLNAITPGDSTITFTVSLTKAGVFTWICNAPCGGSGFWGPPMGVPGYMSGTMTVV